MPTDKLYIKVACTACRGSRMASYYHDPMKPYKWKRCPYCNEQGMTYIEAVERIVLEAAERIRYEEANETDEKN